AVVGMAALLRPSGATAPLLEPRTPRPSGATAPLLEPRTPRPSGATAPLLEPPDPGEQHTGRSQGCHPLGGRPAGPVGAGQSIPASSRPPRGRRNRTSVPRPTSERA